MPAADTYTEAERAVLRGRFTNTDRRTFALTNMPETVKAALFARYSRYGGGLRRLYLDEFADTDVATSTTGENTAASGLFDRVFAGYGDDSVAQLAGAHVGLEGCSQLLTKRLQRPRIASYLEQSTRYIPFDQPAPDGHYRYHTDPNLGPAYDQAMNRLFATYASLLERMRAWAADQHPRRPDDPEAAWRRAINAKALDLVRGLLPAATTTNMGIYASAQTYEQLVLHLLSDPLPEARQRGDELLTELNRVIPSFMTRVPRPDRGGQSVHYLAQRRATGEQWARRLGLHPDTSSATTGPSVDLIDVRGDERDLAAAMLFEHATVSERAVRHRIGRMPDNELAALLAALAGQRDNRRHRPGRGLEAVSYRFEITSDFGAFRDLQRHRMLTCQWQWPTCDLGAEIPPEIDQAGCGDEFRAALDTSRTEHERLRDQHAGDAAHYPVCLAYRMRYVLDLNAREAMQLIELRSGHQGHPSYRAVALAMRDAIAARHPAIATMMTHTDHTTDPRLERIQAEIRNEHRATTDAGQERPS